MELTSSEFKTGARIPDKYTVEGADVSPPLSWTATPPDTKSLALICDDPDAPSRENPADEPWVHWVIYGIASERTELPSGIAQTARPEQLSGAKQGVNSWPSDNLGYRGPAPPPGSGEHRYFFKLYALDTELDLQPAATKQQLLEAMEGHILAEGQTMGTYER